MNEFYIYIYLDPRTSGQYCYENFSFLYKPMYVGKGSNERWKEIGENRRSDYFIRKINKIKSSGLELIFFKLYENLNEEKSFEKEVELINEINIKNPGILVNITDGGEGISGYKHTEETKQKLSEINRGENHPNFGKHLLKETKNKIGEKNRKNFSYIKNEFEKRKYILLSEEKDYKNNETILEYTCPKGHKGSINWNHFQQGCSCSICVDEDARKKISETIKEKYKNGELNQKGEKNYNSILISQDVIQIKLLLKEGKLLQREIADIFGVNRKTISNIKTGITWNHIKI